MDEKSRLATLSRWVKKQKIDAFIVDAPVDLFYLTGLSLSLGRLVIFEEEALLFVDGRYFEAAKKKSPATVLQTQGYKKDSLFVEELKKRAYVKDSIIGFDLDFTSCAASEELKAALRGSYKLKGFGSPVKEMRMVKSEKEIKALKKAAHLGSLGFDFVLSHLKTGITEWELVSLLKIFWLKHKAEDVAFSPIIAFGEGSAFPHYKSGNRKLKKGDVVLIDIGVVLDNYRSDMTRTVFFGKPNPKILEIYAIVKEAQSKALSICKEGVPIAQLDKSAREVIERAGYGVFFSHSLGHGIGLETHEQPYLRKTAQGELKAGMAITIEPGIYLPGTGGVRLEDTVIVTKNGYVNLTKRPL